MGSPFTIIFYHTDSAMADRIAQKCYTIIDTLNAIFSDYDPNSEINKLALVNDRPQKISDELFQMILVSRSARRNSHKTFDITTGNLSQLWRTSGREKTFPGNEAIKKAKMSSGFKNFELDIFTKTIILKNNIHFDFGGIVKGYAAQKIITYLKSENISSALADAGGDIALGDSPPGKSGWVVGINLPEKEEEIWNKKLVLKNCAVATSGDIFRYTLHNGKKYSHIMDPRTGYGVTNQRNVTVIANDGVTADWLATACSILPIKKALKLAKKEKAFLFVAAIKKEDIITYSSKGFDNYFQMNE